MNIGKILEVTGVAVALAAVLVGSKKLDQVVTAPHKLAKTWTKADTVEIRTGWDYSANVGKYLPEGMSIETYQGLHGARQLSIPFDFPKQDEWTGYWEFRYDPEVTHPNAQATQNALENSVNQGK